MRAPLVNMASRILRPAIDYQNGTERLSPMGAIRQGAIADRNAGMNSARQNSGRVSLALPLQMFGGLVIGLLLALLLPSFAQALQPIGTAFIEAIKMIIIPLI